MAFTYIQETQSRTRGQWRGSKEEGSRMEEELWGENLYTSIEKVLC